MLTKYITMEGKELSQEEYLYGEGVRAPKLPKEAVEERLKLLDRHLTKLLEEHWLKRDGGRINAILKAIDFWKQFIKDNT